MTSKIAPPPATADKISLDMAQVEFDRFVNSMDLDVDTSFMDAEDLTGFEKQKRRILAAISKGSLIINENGEPVYTPQKSPTTDPITFHEKDGAALMAMDGKKKNHSMAQTVAVLGALTKVHPSVFAKMKGNDLSICLALFALLMD